MARKFNKLFQFTRNLFFVLSLFRFPSKFCLCRASVRHLSGLRVETERDRERRDCEGKHKVLFVKSMKMFFLVLHFPSSPKGFETSARPPSQPSHFAGVLSRSLLVDVQCVSFPFSIYAIYTFSYGFSSIFPST
jgi:hypothetical protein